MAFKDNLNNTAVCSWSQLKNVNKQKITAPQQYLHVTDTANNGQSSAKICFSLPNFLCYTLSNNTLRNVT